MVGISSARTGRREGAVELVHSALPTQGVVMADRCGDTSQSKLSLAKGKLVTVSRPSW